MGCIEIINLNYTVLNLKKNTAQHFLMLIVPQNIKFYILI